MTCGSDIAAARVQAVWLNRGDGLRCWYRVQVGDVVTYVGSVVAVAGHLAGFGIAGGDLEPVDDGLPDDEDGCE
jgi:hypothetical protein